MKEKTLLSNEVVCVFRWLIARPQVLNMRYRNQNSWKMTSFSKTMALQREPFLTMFYTNNLSPSLVTQKGFMLIIILSNYQQCPLPLNKNYTLEEFLQPQNPEAEYIHMTSITSKVFQMTPFLTRFYRTCNRRESFRLSREKLCHMCLNTIQPYCLSIQKRND